MMRGYAAVWGVGRVRLSAGVGGYAPVQGGGKGRRYAAVQQGGIYAVVFRVLLSNKGR